MNYEREYIAEERRIADLLKQYDGNKAKIVYRPMFECFNRSLKPRIIKRHNVWFVMTNHFRLPWYELTMEEKERIHAAHLYVKQKNWENYIYG